MNLVKHILEGARRRLVLLPLGASLCDAAALLANPNTPLIVVCDSAGMASGVISSSDLVRALSRAGSDALDVTAMELMTTPILSCDVNQSLQSLWSVMGERRLRCIPVLDDSGRPRGVAHARDIAAALLDEVSNEELLLRDYVLGIGYQ